MYEKKLKEENSDLSSRVLILQKEKEIIKTDSQKQFEKINKAKEQEILFLTDEYEKKLLELKQKYEITNIENAKENEVSRNKYVNIIGKLNAEIKEMKTTYESTIDNLKTENQKISGESQDLIKEKTQHNIQLKETIKKLQENFENLNNLNLSNVNKQKDLYDKEITKRDNNIIQLERQLKLLSEESQDKIVFLERKINNINQEYDIVFSKNIEYKSIIEKAEQNMSILKAEIIVNYEEKERYVEKLKKLDESQNKMELKIIELKNKEHEYKRMKEEVEKLTISESNLKNDLTRISEELNFVKTDNDKKSRAYDAMKNNFSKTSLKLSQDVKAKEEMIEQLKKQLTDIENKSELKRLKEYIEFLEKYKEEGIEKSCVELKKYEENLRNCKEHYENRIEELKQLLQKQVQNFTN